ncbi:XkdX family protein [Paenibacillus lactis]|uniref:XkdX family protein n=1 Tax=Paenibacillus lactis TaxID=228574 RepID=UPI001BCC3E28
MKGDVRIICYLITKRYYDSQHPLYNNDSLKFFVSAKMIMPKEYKLITNVDFVA